MLGKKRARADESYHKVAAGETLWDISQQYGLQMKKLKRYNRIESNADPEAGHDFISVVDEAAKQ